MERFTYEIKIKDIFIECITELVNYIDEFKQGKMDSNSFRLHVLIIAAKYLSEYDEGKLNLVNSYLSTSLIEFNETMLKCETLIPDFIKYGKANIDILSNEIERCISSFYYSLGGYLNNSNNDLKGTV